MLFLRRLGRAGLLAVGLLQALPAAGQATRPNVVFVLFDDVGPADLGAFGGGFVQTPEIDAVASEGMRFTNFHSNGPMCTASRVGLLTGRDPARFGIRRNLSAVSARGVPPEVPTLAKVLKQAGYATGHFGKWHIGGASEQFLPQGLGFDESVIRYGNGSYLDPFLSIDGGPAVQTSGHLTELITDHALAFLSAHQHEPFFLNLWYQAPHKPYEPPAAWAAQYPDTDVGRYAALLSHADDQLGRIVEAIRQLGLEDDTLLIVAGDNGPTIKSIRSNGNLRGGKGSVWEGGLRVPLVVRWPGSVAAGSSSDALVMGFDLLPTVAELVGSDPGELGGDGISLAGLWTGAPQAIPERLLVWERWEEHLDGQVPHSFAARRGDWKLVKTYWSVSEEPELYDLANDPLEQTDVAAANPAIAADLNFAYRSWRRQIDRVTPQLVATGPGATVEGPWLTLFGGAVQVDGLPGVPVHDGDFTFRVRVTPSELGSDQTIAQHRGSWRLIALSYGAVRLVVQGTTGNKTQLDSTARLQPGVSSEIAFTIYGRLDDLVGSGVRLFVDGELQAETREIDAVALPLSPLLLGGNPAAGSLFSGLLWNPQIYLDALYPDELRDLDMDGAPDGADNCIAAPNGPDWRDEGGNVQLDSDGDGFGNACDADFDDNGWVGGLDLVRMLDGYASSGGQPGYHPELDLDGDGLIGFADYLLCLEAFGTRPGPSGKVP